MNPLLWFLSIFISLGVAAQQAVTFYPWTDISGTEASHTFQYPFEGGLNLPQFSEVDLNGDAFMDLFVFDRSADLAITFLNDGIANTVSYTYAPQYTRYMPDMINWALARDYDCDGYFDIFTNDAGSPSIRVYRGSAGPNGIQQFTLVADPLEFKYNAISEDIFLLDSDIPGIADINGDGDIDIVTFESNGSWIYYYENQSVENTGNCGQLSYKLVDGCWADFYELSAGNLGIMDTCHIGGMPNIRGTGLRHSGSTICVADLTNNGRYDALIGDLSYTTLYTLFNTGTPTNAYATSMDTTWPKYDQAVDISQFPAAYWMDFNNDGAPDIMSAPNARFISQNRQNTWYYKNNNAPVPSYLLQNKNQMTMEAVDHGQQSNVAFLDQNKDGLLDIVVGNNFVYDSQGKSFSSLMLLQNVGTLDSPAYYLADNNFANLAQYNLYNIYPTFGDVDDDGDMDMVIGDSEGRIHFFNNPSGPSSPATYPVITPVWFGLDSLGSYLAPQLVDVNRDGKLDLLVGVRTGYIKYFENKGTKSVPLFSDMPDDNFFGDVDIRFFDYLLNGYDGFCRPHLTDIDGDNQYDLLVGNGEGRIWLYKDIDNNLTGKFTLVSSDYGHIRTGRQTTIAVANIDNDAYPDMLTGNIRGGLQFFHGALDTSNAIAHPVKPTFSIYPNPSDGRFYLPAGIRNGNLEVLSLSGSCIYSKWIGTDDMLIDLPAVPKGLYLLRFNTPQQQLTSKITIMR